MRKLLFIIIVSSVLQQNNLFSQGCNLISDSTDSLLFCKRTNELKNKTGNNFNEILIKTALEFQETPYVGKTLDREEKESLVVNLSELDCSTYLESVISIFERLY